MSAPDTPTSAELEACRTWCRGTGWLHRPDAEAPVPCLVHKPHLRMGTLFTNDSDPKSRHKPMTAAPAAIVPPPGGEPR